MASAVHCTMSVGDCSAEVLNVQGISAPPSSRQSSSPQCGQMALSRAGSGQDRAPLWKLLQLLNLGSPLLWDEEGLLDVLAAAAAAAVAADWVQTD